MNYTLLFSKMTFEELTIAFEALKYSPSKGVRDEVMQELMGQELDRMEAKYDGL